VGWREVCEGSAGAVFGRSCLKIGDQPCRQEIPMTSAPTTPLRQRMIEDMTIRQFGSKIHCARGAARRLNAYNPEPPQAAVSP